MRSQTLVVIAGSRGSAWCRGLRREPGIIEDRANHVKLRWYNWDADLHDAARMADARCARRGRNAEFEQETLDADVSLAEFMCR